MLYKACHTCTCTTVCMCVHLVQHLLCPILPSYMIHVHVHVPTVSLYIALVMFISGTAQLHVYYTCIVMVIPLCFSNAVHVVPFLMLFFSRRKEMV